ncbi:peptidase U32 [Gordonibacter sp. 28C]|uniref:U32 family peptidase n=1 Tax=Gordonibacter sp. 28C TaxID=2078569 RepID=UPI000DF753DA|nr:U32 family peptidase [Gordonibacter sp. 28C]RDB63907.1 peptidase U32 [Gordonibacter sp. 28C]
MSHQIEEAPPVELLAPAGSVEALHAAVAGGADAVYLGLDAFNARRNADNFTLATLGDACDYAHLRGVRVYVTLNTAILPSEADRALECARQAYRAGADAFIVQDIGLAAELARTLPQARLHISTQMNTHNAAGIEAAAKLGARRVTLARELSLAEVAHLSSVASGLGMEVEAFAHGALCVCYSGQCFMSSMIGGRSANRGLCAQACRLPYELRNRAQRKELPSPGDHLLSPQDLCTIDLVPELVEAGAASLKIEGRMKSADYVFAVTSAYRAVLDRVLAARPDVSVRATDEERRVLEEAFSRGFTTAYLTGQRGNDIMSYGRPNNRGVFVGRVAYARDGVAGIAVEEELHEGDVLEFWTNKGHFAHTLGPVEVDKKGNVRTAPQRAVGKGDRVFRVRNAAAGFADDPLAPRIPVAGSARLRRGEPLRMEFSLVDAHGVARVVGSAEGDVVEAARTKAVEAQDVRTHIDRLGQTPFELVSLDVDLDDGVGIGFSQLHRVRAEALDDLAMRLLAPYRDRALPRVQERARRSPAERRGCSIAAWTTNPVCARAAKRAGADVVYVPALNYKRGEAVIAGQRTGTAEQAGYPKQCVTALPVVDHDPVPGTREEALGFDPWRYVKPGKPVLAENLGAVARALEMGAVVEAGPHLPVTNRLSLETMADLGVERVWLSPELTLGQVADLAENAPVALGLTIMGAQELMVCEHCLLMGQGPCDERCDECVRRKSPHYLKDRKDYEFPVVTDALGRSHVYNGVVLDVAQVVPDLIAAGVSALMVDATLMNGEETASAVARAVRARDVAQRDGNALAKTPGTTSGHLFRGVS